MKKPYPKSQLLKETLADWESIDLASYKLACSLGILPPEDGSYDGYRACKWVFNSSNPLNETLIDFLSELVNRGVLEYDNEHLGFRWNPKWDPAKLEGQTDIKNK